MNHERAALAASAQQLSETSAITVQTSPSTSSWRGTWPRPGSANWGSTAAKKTVVLGLLSPTTKACQVTRRGETPAVAPGGGEPDAAARRRLRMVWTPRYTR